MSILTVFEFNNNQVRFVGTPERPEWIAKDVCDCLGLSNVSEALKGLEKYDCGEFIITDATNRLQTHITIYEAGLYELIFKSRKPEAKTFKRWIFEQVLPSIRKTGSYSVQPQVPQLPCHEVALLKARAIAEIDEILAHQPRLAQMLIDHTISDLMSQKALSGVVLKGVVEIAESLKLPVNMHNRSALGKFVKSQIPHLAKSEERLVNGTVRQVACYPDTEEVKSIITLFFTR